VVKAPAPDRGRCHDGSRHHRSQISHPSSATEFWQVTGRYGRN
jgi:hypothetical protein